MTCFELVAALDDLGLTQSRLSSVCGVERQQAWRWCDGRNPVPDFVRSILSMIKTGNPARVIAGYRHEWAVERHHVYRGRQDFKLLAKKWHPDFNKRDTTREMQLILRFRR